MKILKTAVILSAVILAVLTGTIICSASIITDGEQYYLAGDANGDGQVDVRDLVRLKKNSSEGGVCPAADFDLDGTVSAKDLTVLRRMLLGSDSSLWSGSLK